MLIVLLPEQPLREGDAAQALNWWRMERDGAVQASGQDTLAALRQRFPAERLRALAPAAAVNLFRVRLPAQRAAAARVALPYALEDLVSQELDELHIVMGPRRSDGQVSAAVVSHTPMRAWLECFRVAGWRLEALLPQAALHADQSPEHALLVMPSPWPTDSQVLVLSAQEEPVLLDPSLAGIWINRRLAGLEPQAQKLTLAGLSADELGLTLPATVEVQQLPEKDHLAAALVQAQRSTPAFNLLGGPYAVSMAAPPWRKMRPALIAAAVALALGLGWLTGEHMILSQERDSLRADIGRLFDRSLPNSRREDPVMQFRQVLQGGAQISSNSGMGPLLHAFFVVLKEHDNAQVQQVRGSLESVVVELKVASFSELEAIRAALAAQPGVSENLEGADSENEGVTARIKLQRGGA
ncbi:type II secretion system protein GspL [Halopseudomonas sabulinigri]|uniref:Type II secretion system protein L n=1 Tax=Halopseudomonas sabulinigri TaxID=472181 RepID=A0ABP9ZQM7_9GAMM